MCKVYKKDYDKKPKILIPILFTKKFDKKSCKMDIYKAGGKVYNSIPE